MHKLKASGRKIATIALTLAVSTWLPAACAQTWQTQNLTIPTAVENTACNAASDKLATTASPIKLLICQSGVWTKQSASAVVTALYLRSAIGAGFPAACPAAWIQADFGTVSETSWMSNFVRTCLAPSNKTCSVLYLKNPSEAPPTCPARWVEVDQKIVFDGGDYGGGYLRSCIHCE